MCEPINWTYVYTYQFIKIIKFISQFSIFTVPYVCVVIVKLEMRGDENRELVVEGGGQLEVQFVRNHDEDDDQVYFVCHWIVVFYMCLLRFLAFLLE